MLRWLQIVVGGDFPRQVRILTAGTSRAAAVTGLRRWTKASYEFFKNKRAQLSNALNVSRPSSVLQPMERKEKSNRRRGRSSSHSLKMQFDHVKIIFESHFCLFAELSLFNFNLEFAQTKTQSNGTKRKFAREFGVQEV